MSLFATIQDEVGEWAEENFPGQPALNPYLGTSEEAGELADTLDLESPPDEEELDAVGDVLVYAADFCWRRDLDYQAAYDDSQDLEPRHDDFFREWTAARGQLTRSILKQRHGIRLDEDRVGAEAEHDALARMLCALETFATKRGYTLEDAIQCAWYEEVIHREWDSAYKD